MEAIYDLYRQYPSVQTDTRKLKEGDLFFAIKGPNYNGNLFAEKAIAMGAAYAFVDEAVPGGSGRIIQTGNTLATLQELAKFHRMQFGGSRQSPGAIPFIAITGSNGKTTTKELVHEVLSSNYITYTTEGNLNNHIGIPLTILKIKPDAQMAVIEMGANHLQEIAGYCQYAMPTHGLITNIGKAHLEGFGGIENVKKGKGELFDYLKANDGVAFVNEDDAAVQSIAMGIAQKISYGKAGKDISGRIIKSDPFAQILLEGDHPLEIKTKLAGGYNLPNVLAAVCIGRYFKIADERIVQSIEKYQPTNSRSQIIHQDGNTIILDAYNANPASMKAAIENFAGITGNKKILLLGSMMELGDDSPKEHAALIELIDHYQWDDVVLVGDNFNRLEHRYVKCENALAAREWLQKKQLSAAQILIKGSRSVQMEKVLE